MSRGSRTDGTNHSPRDFFLHPARRPVTKRTFQAALLSRHESNRCRARRDKSFRYSARVFCAILRPNMPLADGTRLEHYEIIGMLGAGGMGEVYRAVDTKLRRDVALKILPSKFASDPSRLARFEREAHLLASLNHPNIGAIYGLENAGGMRFLVLELVEGSTLAERLKSGPLDI